MPSRTSIHAALIVAAFAGFVVVLGIRRVEHTMSPSPGAGVAKSFAAEGEEIGSVAGLRTDDTEAGRAAVAAMLRERFGRSHVRRDEAVLTFKDAESLRAFLARAGGGGVLVAGRIDELLAVRVKISDYDAFVRELAGHVADYSSVASNVIVAAPKPPSEERTARQSVAVGPHLLAVLGVTADNSAWGSGVLIAVLDGGAAQDNTFGNRMQYLDIGYGRHGLGADGAHATSVAALAAGYAADARGVAPSASLLSIRVTGPDGLSDTFSLAQGIYAAVGAGAQVINVSLGGYATNALLGDAVDHALASGAAVVAASGNDQAAQVVWPAAYAGVVSVGAVDALGTQAMFSNSGEQLLLTAPGIGIQTAGAGGDRVNFSGTSASAPVVSGAIAALMSQNPGLTALAAADILLDYSNDAGAEGFDPDYGVGSLNLGWAMERADVSRMDPAIAGQSYDAETKVLSVLVQNRGAQTVSGLKLAVTIENETETIELPSLASRVSTTVRLPVKSARLANGGEVSVISQLIVPPGVIDRDTSNNRRAGVITR